jgi:hypothetical protein
VDRLVPGLRRRPRSDHRDSVFAEAIQFVSLRLPVDAWRERFGGWRRQGEDVLLGVVQANTIVWTHFGDSCGITKAATPISEPKSG